MKKILILGFALLSLYLTTSSAFANGDTPGSSTSVDDLRRNRNTCQQTYTEVHTGNLVTAACKVAHTDSVRDSHPFFLEDEEDGGGEE